MRNDGALTNQAREGIHSAEIQLRKQKRGQDQAEETSVLSGEKNAEYHIRYRIAQNCHDSQV